MEEGTTVFQVLRGEQEGAGSSVDQTAGKRKVTMSKCLALGALSSSSICPKFVTQNIV